MHERAVFVVIATIAQSRVLWLRRQDGEVNGWLGTVANSCDQDALAGEAFTPGVLPRHTWHPTD